MRTIFDTLQTSQYPIQEARSPDHQIHNSILTVKFDKLAQFTDTDMAVTCVEVLASNGKIGSLTHLEAGQDPDAFATALKNFYVQPANVVLAGGRESLEISVDSMRFVTALRAALVDKKFHISGEDVGGTNIYRHSTLYRDKAIIHKTDLATYKKDVAIFF